MKKGFTIIEILIAMLILFTAIGFVNISIKAFNNYQRKSEVYQKFYITALSLKNRMDIEVLDKDSYIGVLNGINYKIEKKEIVKQKNFILDFESIGNNGDFFITLYKLDMRLSTKSKSKKYTFYLTRQKRIHPFIEEGVD